MCGRFSLFHNVEEIRRRFKLRELFGEWVKRYNIAPEQRILIVREGAGEPVVEGVKWGLIPHWGKEGGKGIINARAEGIEAKPTFRDSFKGKRCLIVADGFYEWQRQGSKKQPYYITLKDRGLFAFAGLYDDWHGSRAAAIITVPPNGLMKPIHERMPAILQPEDEPLWIGPRTDLERLSGLLKPYPDAGLSAIQIGKRVNDTKNEGEDLTYPEDNIQQRLI